MSGYSAGTMAFHVAVMNRNIAQSCLGIIWVLSEGYLRVAWCCPVLSGCCLNILSG